MEDGPVKEGFVQTIGSYMKLAYKTWNREHYVNDEIIKGDLETLSGGKLTLEDNSRIDGLANASRSRGRDNRDSRSSSSSRDNRGGSRDNRNRNDNRSSGGSRDNRDNRGGSRDNKNNNNRKRK